MESESKCPKCGTALSRDGKASICPKCVATMILGRTVQYFGDYELLEEIGRGGMGVVYRARQSSLNRPVALKMMIQGGFASPEFVRRFQNEAETAASLQHPNIVAIYEVGLIEGLHYFSMDYIDGPSLAEVVREGPLPAERAARYVELVAEAIHHAHQRGILHRDLKPSNVLIDPFDQPRVTDFGLAKRLDHDLGPTFTGQVLGSPGYMPPEQAAGRHSLIGVTSDVYALGAILYHLLTGQAPFAGENAAQVLVRVQKEEPAPPRALNPGIPRDLETICLKCLRKQPDQRYASAAELAADLRHWQKGESIAARRQRVGGELLSWCGRHPRAALAAGLVSLAIAAFGFGSWWFTARIHESAAGSTAPTPAVVSPLPGQQIGQQWTNSLGMVFVPVAGTAVQFSIWDTRVQDYQAFATATGRSWEKPKFEQGPTHPAVMVNWDDAKAFCAWLTEKERRAGTLKPAQEYRLPTDLEWSAAVGLEKEGGGTPQERSEKNADLFPWGTQWPRPQGAGNYGGRGFDTFTNTSPVGSFAANRFGLYDMGGNVHQYCEDFYDGQSGSHLTRGAAWNSSRRNSLLSSARRKTRPGARMGHIGFRCVLAGGGVSAPQAQSGAASTAARSPAAIPAVVLPGPSLQTAHRWTNSLGMIFVPADGTLVQFSIWDTRVQDYRAFVTDTRRAWGKPSFGQGPTHPAVMVSWDDARAFCQWLTDRERKARLISEGQSYRLPTDAEWSVAVGLSQEFGGTPKDKNDGIKDVYPWGTQWPPPNGAGNIATNRGVDSYENTSPVGSFAANGFGLYDMGGNVWQWCEDLYDSQSGSRVLRGASWLTGGGYLLSSHRFDRTPGVRRDDVGFRCVLAGGGLSASQVQPGPTRAIARSPAPRPAIVAPSPVQQPGQRWANSLGMIFVPVPGTLVRFSIWHTRVQDFEAFVQATGHDATKGMRSRDKGANRWQARGDTWKSPGFAQGPTHPVGGLSWADAKAFCEWLTEKERSAGWLQAGQTYRLPTDAEWSIAVGLVNEPGNTPADKNGKIKGVYPWGNQWPPPRGAGNYGQSHGVDNYDFTSPVGSFAANRFCLYDMGGNLWQWCEDSRRPGEEFRVMRGASWVKHAQVDLLASCRYFIRPNTRFDMYGFRCVLASSGVSAP